MPAITASASSETVCLSCQTDLESQALKCSKCQCFVHLHCSGLPDYFLIRFATSQSQYVCRNCVRSQDMDEEDFNSELTKIHEVIAKEKSSIERLNVEADSESGDGARESLTENTDSVVNDSAVNNNSGVQTSSNSNGADNSKKNQTICRFFLRRNCKHGIVGKNCDFQHPKLCHKFTKNGDKNGGCKKTQCKFFHPNLCRSSLKERKCLKKNCRFFHLNGTQREESSKITNPSNVTNKDQPASENRVTVSSSYSQAVRQRAPLAGDSSGPSPGQSVADSSNNYMTGDFLWVKQQLQQLTMQMAQMSLVLNQLQKGDQCCPRRGQH